MESGLTFGIRHIKVKKSNLTAKDSGPSYMAVLLIMTDYSDGFLVAPALPHLSPRLNSNDSEVLKNCSCSTGLGTIYALKLA